MSVLSVAEGADKNNRPRSPTAIEGKGGRLHARGRSGAYESEALQV
jgi:hypothetical protein